MLKQLSWRLYITTAFMMMPALEGRGDILSEQIKSYSIISDFEDYPEIARIGEHVFWSYGFDKLDGDQSHLVVNFEVDPQDVPVTLGSGLLVQHLNRGRVLFFNGDYQEAARIWRSAALKFKKSDLHYRRLNFFTALAYLKLIDRAALAQKKEDAIYQIAISANLLADALIDYGDQFDSLLDRLSSKYFYYLATLYYLGGDVGKSTVAAQHGINTFIEGKNGNYRSQLRFLLTDTFLQNRDYLQAAQQIDAVIREESSLAVTLKGFEKLGDLYSSLHNYRLARDFYNRALSLSDKKNTKGSLFAKMAEAQFWLGEYKNSAEFFQSALHQPNTPIPVRQWSKLRLADIILAQQNSEKATFSYFDVVQSIADSPAKDLAQIRSICLDLPKLFGSSRNFNYASAKLIAKSDLKFFGKTYTQSLATSCYIASLISTTKEYIQRITSFQKTRPDSLFISQMAVISQNIQREKIMHLLANHRYEDAIKHYETLASTMYKNPSRELRLGLVRAYVSLEKYTKAKDFFELEDIRTTRDRMIALDLLINGKFESRSSDLLKIAKGIKEQTQLNDPSEFSSLSKILQANTKGFDAAWAMDTFHFRLSQKKDCEFLAQSLSITGLKKYSSLERVGVKLSALLSSMQDYEKANQNCLYDIADIEYFLYERQDLGLAKIYLNRPEAWWKLSHVIDLAWQITENIPSDEWAMRRQMFEKVVAYARAGSWARTYAANQLQSQSLGH